MSGHDHQWLTIRRINDVTNVEVCTICLAARATTPQEDT